MSFLGGLKNIGKVVLGIASSPVAGTVVGLFNPALGAIVTRLSGAISNIEAAHAQAGKEKSGAEKFSYVTTDFNESLAVMREILRAEGRDLTCDGIALENAINMQVAALNAAAKLKDSIRIIEIPK